MYAERGVLLPLREIIPDNLDVTAKLNVNDGKLREKRCVCPRIYKFIILDFQRLDTERVYYLGVESRDCVILEDDAVVVEKVICTGIFRNDRVNLEYGLRLAPAYPEIGKAVFRITTLRVLPDSNQ